MREAILREAQRHGHKPEDLQERLNERDVRFLRAHFMFRAGIAASGEYGLQRNHWIRCSPFLLARMSGISNERPGESPQRDEQGLIARGSRRPCEGYGPDGGIR